jgi:hypothetical protein
MIDTSQPSDPRRIVLLPKLGRPSGPSARRVSGPALAVDLKMSAALEAPKRTGGHRPVDAVDRP